MFSVDYGDKFTVTLCDVSTVNNHLSRAEKPATLKGPSAVSNKYIF